MRTIKLSDEHSISLWESIHQMPERVRIEFNAFLLMESGIGADVDSAENRVSRVTAFLAAQDMDAALDELANLHYCLNFITERFSPKSLAFGCLVASVDGVPFTDLSETGLTALRDRLSGYGLTAGMVDAEVATVKKKLAEELKEHFPARFDTSSAQTNYYQQQQRRALVLCDYVLTQDATHLESIQIIDAWLLEQNKPDIFDSGHPENVLVSMRNAFGQTCAALAELGYPNAGDLPIFQFQSAVNYLIQKRKGD